jgi:hypothetical protein
MGARLEQRLVFFYLYFRDTYLFKTKSMHCIVGLKCISMWQVWQPWQVRQRCRMNLMRLKLSGVLRHNGTNWNSYTTTQTSEKRNSKIHMRTILEDFISHKEDKKGRTKIHEKRWSNENKSKMVDGRPESCCISSHTVYKWINSCN